MRAIRELNPEWELRGSPEGRRYSCVVNAPPPAKSPSEGILTKSMLEAFKKIGELQAVVTAAREERAALSTMLEQVHRHGSKLAAAGAAFQDVDARVARTLSRIETIGERLAAMGDLASGIERATALLARVPELEARMDAISARLADVDASVAGTAKALTVTQEIDGRLSRLATAVDEIEARQQEVASHAAAIEKQAERLHATAAQVRMQQGARAAADRELLTDIHGQASAIASGLEAVRLQMAAGETRGPAVDVLASVAELDGLVRQARSRLEQPQAGAPTLVRK